MKYNYTYIFISLFLELNMSTVTFGFKEWLINMCAGCSHLPALESRSQEKADKTYFHSFYHSLQSRKPFPTAKNFSGFFVPVGCWHRASSWAFSVVKCHLVCAGARITWKKISFASDLAFNNCTNKVKSRTTSGVQPLLRWDAVKLSGAWRCSPSPPYWWCSLGKPGLDPAGMFGVWLPRRHAREHRA